MESVEQETLPHTGFEINKSHNKPNYYIWNDRPKERNRVKGRHIVTKDVKNLLNKRVFRNGDPHEDPLRFDSLSSIFKLSVKTVSRF